MTPRGPKLFRRMLALSLSRLFPLFLRMALQRTLVLTLVLCAVSSSLAYGVSGERVDRSESLYQGIDPKKTYASSSRHVIELYHYSVLFNIQIDLITDTSGLLQSLKMMHNFLAKVDHLPRPSRLEAHRYMRP